MKPTLQVNATVQLSVIQLFELAQQLSKTQKRKLISLLEQDDAPTGEELLEQIKQDYIALKNGTLKTRPASEFLAELKEEGLL
ncbi:MAG: hypothetical protein U0Y10_25440 [Spirosomataceae bacterium]